ncbi:hypothetical protein LXL04_013944 [Taraxacum kok-saghyz]
MRGDEGEWQTVFRKGSQRRNRVGNGSHPSRKGGDDSFYVTNFPGYVTVNDLWNLCRQNTFILEDRLRSIWIGSFHLFARYARFSKTGEVHGNVNASVEHARRNPGVPTRRDVEGSLHGRSYVNVVKNVKEKEKNQTVLREVLSILDGLLAVESDHQLSLFVAVAKPKVIPNFKSLCAAEGFGDVIVRNVGGRWIMITLANEDSKNAFQSCNAVMSLLKQIKPVTKDFVVDERYIWIELKGLPFAAWSDPVVDLVVSKWGELMFVEDDADYPLGSRRVCIAYANKKPLHEDLLIKVGSVRYHVYVKELTEWEVEMELADFNQDEEGSFIGSDVGSHGGEHEDVYEEGEIGEFGSGGCGFTTRDHHKS